MKQLESIILAFANVMNDSLKHLNPELQKIRNVLKNAEEENSLNIIEHNGVTYNSLSFLLNSAKGKDVTMLHFSGHSSKNGLLVQSHDESGVVSKKPLSNLIKAHRKFRFVFLNSCYSKEIAQELIESGVPYVIGTSDRVKDGVAAVVAAKFYSLLAKSGKTIEEAFLLTKDYIEDPMNDDDADHKEAFRTFQIFDDTKNEYPWQLYQSTELKDKDKHWVLIKKSPLKLYLILGAIGIMVVLLYAVFEVYKSSGKDKLIPGPADTSGYSQNKENVSGSLNKASKHIDSSLKHLLSIPDRNSGHRTVLAIPTAGKGTLETSAKRIFANLKIVDSSHQYNNDVTTKVRDIFYKKGYPFGEAGSDLPAGSYDNIVSGKLTLSQPVKTMGPFNTVVMDYTVMLTLGFSDGVGKLACGQREYSAKVSTTDKDTKERILHQGLNDVLDLLQKETNFPFCVKK